MLALPGIHGMVTHLCKNPTNEENFGSAKNKKFVFESSHSFLGASQVQHNTITAC